ncbi:MAG: S8 family serine peptidase [Mycobacteriales bacterium]
MGRTLALLAATAVAAGIGAAVPAAEAVPAKAPPGGVGTRTETFTLVTGDRVRLTSLRNGRQAAQVIQPRPGIGYQTQTSNGHLSVLPSDALGQLAAHRLDPRLFDLTLLARFGYDDAHTADIPLLAATHGAAAALPTPTRTAKKDAARYWRGLRAPHAQLAGMDRLWLDGKTYPALDQSVPQIGAPAAWQAGYTGAGVPVAILDTGYDTGHPDLTAAVATSEDFTGEGIQDQVGHGTHVASIVAGSGAASDGKYKGVAPGARLAIGKVCTWDGCLDSWLLAGMRWAAVDQHAKVVNMSLGCSPNFCQADGSGPLDQAVNTLTAQTGTLFVVSAGNDGTNAQVSTPATADAALAVASVTKQDALSDFSSRGPRTGDDALKPDVAAPGQDIVAARAAGSDIGQPVGDHYQRLSGTSMAAPHVTGAAAILAQEHPDWTAARLKSVLMSTSKPIAGADAYGVGAGRIDVARAYRQQVTADTGSVSFGLASWPHGGQQAATRPITYRNDGDDPVTLALALGTGAPAGVFTLGATSLAVPAHGTATTTVGFDPTKGVGLFSGYVTATAGDTVVRTGVGGYSEEERYNLTLKLLDAAGNPASPDLASVTVHDRTDGTDIGYRNGGLLNPDGTVTLRLRAGHLAVDGYFTTADSDDWITNETMVMRPDVNLTGDTTLTLDARTARPVVVQATGRPSAVPDAQFAGWRVGGGGDEIFCDTRITCATASAGPSSSDFTFYDRATLTEPLMTITAGGATIPLSRHPAGGSLFGDRQLTAVDGGHATAGDLAKIDATGKVVVVASTEGDDPLAQIAAVEKAGAVLAVLVYDGFSFPLADGTAMAVATVHSYAARSLLAAVAGGPAAVTTHSLRASPYVYEMANAEHGSAPTGRTYVARPEQMATVRSRYHAAGGDLGMMTPVLAVVGGIPEYGSTPRVVGPVERTTYFSAGEDVSWQPEVLLGDFFGRGSFGGDQQEAPVTYRPGQQLTEDWQGASYGPRVSTPSLATDQKGDPVPWAVLEGGTLSATLPLLSDSDPRHAGSTEGTGSTTLSRDGTVIGTVATPGGGVWTVPAGSGWYTLGSEINRTAGYWRGPSTVRATWTFGASGDEVLPLLDARPEVPVDLADTVPAGCAFTMPVTVGRQQGSPSAPAASLAAWVSYDGGAHWQATTVAPAGRDRFSVRVPGGGAAGGAVSLRVTAGDTAGDTLDETITNAWLLR